MITRLFTPSTTGYMERDLGTIHKRRLPKGGGRGVPPKGDVRRWGGGTLFRPKETSFFYHLKWSKRQHFPLIIKTK